jgi:hypothetical protein
MKRYTLLNMVAVAIIFCIIGSLLGAVGMNAYNGYQIQKEQAISTAFALTVTASTEIPTATSTRTVQPAPTDTHVPTAQPLPSSSDDAVRCVDAMKHTQDKAREWPRDADQQAAYTRDRIEPIVSEIEKLNANCVAISMPLNDVPGAGSALSFIEAWVRTIRAHNNMHVWYRLKHTGYNAFYDMPFILDPQFHTDVHYDFITQNPQLFEAGDIYTPNTEPFMGITVKDENGNDHTYGTIKGVNCYGIPAPHQDDCHFGSADEFNEYIVKFYDRTKEAFETIGKSGVKVGYFGFDGYIAWGDDNPDWGPGKSVALYQETIKETGNALAFDHQWKKPDSDMVSTDYALIRSFYKDDPTLWPIVEKAIDSEKETGRPSPIVTFAKIRAYFPDVELCIGEWGANEVYNTPDEVKEVLEAAYLFGIRCFNYWQVGPDGNEENGERLLKKDGDTLIELPIYSAVQDFYESIK